MQGLILTKLSRSCWKGNRAPSERGDQGVLYPSQHVRPSWHSLLIIDHCLKASASLWVAGSPTLGVHAGLANPKVEGWYRHPESLESLEFVSISPASSSSFTVVSYIFYRPHRRPTNSESFESTLQLHLVPVPRSSPPAPFDQNCPLNQRPLQVSSSNFTIASCPLCSSRPRIQREI